MWCIGVQALGIVYKVNLVSGFDEDKGGVLSLKRCQTGVVYSHTIVHLCGRHSSSQTSHRFSTLLYSILQFLESVYIK